MARRRTWVRVVVGALIVLAVVLTPIIIDLSPE